MKFGIESKNEGFNEFEFYFRGKKLTDNIKGCRVGGHRSIY